MASATQPVFLDVLLLHGKSEELVRLFGEFFTSLGLSAGPVLATPSAGRSQEERVREAIKSCRLPVIVATFNEDEPQSASPRPNVIDDVRTCRELRGTDFVVLREARGGTKVSLASNTDGHLVVIEFSAASPLACAPQLNRELVARGLLRPVDPGPEVHVEGTILSGFVDAMDDLWEHHLDDAWNAVYRKDARAERALTNEIDKFFQQYHVVFAAAAKHRVRGEPLRQRCEQSVTGAQEVAIRCWTAAAEGVRASTLRRLPATGGVRRRSRGARASARMDRLRQEVDESWERFHRALRVKKTPFSERAEALRAIVNRLLALAREAEPGA